MSLKTRNEAVGLNLSHVKFQRRCVRAPCLLLSLSHVWSPSNPFFSTPSPGWLSIGIPQKMEWFRKKHKEHEKYQWIIHWIPPKTHQSLVSNFGISKKKITLWLWLTVCHGKSPFIIGKPSISMGHFPWQTVSHKQMVPIFDDQSQWPSARWGAHSAFVPLVSC